jgi:hypothetical protein
MTCGDGKFNMNFRNRAKEWPAREISRDAAHVSGPLSGVRQGGFQQRSTDN